MSSGTCLACHSSCLWCHTAATNCTRCNTGRFLLNNVCHTTCPDTYFNNLNTNDVILDRGPICSACNANCLWCSGSATHCTKCLVATGYLTNHTDHRCVTNCPANHFKNLVVADFPWCQPCAANCTECTGPLYTQCTRCAVGSCLDALYPAGPGTTCVNYVRNTAWGKACTQNQYCDISDPTTPVCSLCPESCTLCDNANNGTCHACINNYYHDGAGTCRFCDSNCTLCSWSGNNNC
jgi:proprotein convertase subtilisin/kexin type 5